MNYSSYNYGFWIPAPNNLFYSVPCVPVQQNQTSSAHFPNITNNQAFSNSTKHPDKVQANETEMLPDPDCHRHATKSAVVQQNQNCFVRVPNIINFQAFSNNIENRNEDKLSEEEILPDYHCHAGIPIVAAEQNQNGYKHLPYSSVQSISDWLKNPNNDKIHEAKILTDFSCDTTEPAVAVKQNQNGFINLPYITGVESVLNWVKSPSKDKARILPNYHCPITEPTVAVKQKRNYFANLPYIISMQSFSNCIKNSHKDNVNEEILPDYHCYACSLTILTYVEFKEHIVNFHNKAVATKPNSLCPSLCIKPVLNRTNYLGTIGCTEKGNHREIIYRCSHCQETFKNRGIFKHHVNKHREKNYSCAICKISFAGNSSFRKHLGMLHKEKSNRRRCPYCDYGCFQTSDLEKHIARRHTRDFKYKCSLCIKGFTTPKELDNHIMRKHSKVKVVMDFCVEK